MKDIELTDDEFQALQGIADAPALGIETAKEPNASKRLFDHGYVTKDESGHLVITIKGKRLLRPA
jgi:Mn-dependent DtxR family transcriptional regulator